jgi:hypothetical protein
VLRVSDGTLTTDQPFSITVINTNDAPSFTSTPVTDAEEDVLYIYEIRVTDLDAGAVLSITAPTLPAWLTITDNGDGTAVLTGTPENGHVGINDVTLRVNDTVMDVDQIFTIDVGNTNDGPSFTSTPVARVDEDTQYRYDITATDPDLGNTLAITAPTLPAWLTIADHGDGTATLTGTPINNQVGDHTVSLQVSDGVELASQLFTLTVTNINDAPVLAQPLDQTNELGNVVSLQLSGSDVDAGDTLTYSASGLPDGLSLNTATGLITGTITGAANTYTVTASADDGHIGGTDSKTFNWTITEPSTVTHSIPLVVGWNLISFKVHPENTEVAAVLASIDGHYDLVFAWDATNMSDHWLMYDPAMPFGNSLEHLDATMGFWIHMTVADTLEVVGTIPVTTTIHLHPGWNMVGYPATVDRALPDGMNDIEFSLMYAYHAGDTTPWRMYDPEMPFGNDLTELAPGWGYWIKVATEQTWTVSYLSD